MKSTVIIPARFSSSRFPGKPLVNLLGKPMIIWVADICAKAIGTENVYVATENKEIALVTKNYGYKSIMTSSDLLTGTDRVAEAAKKIDSDIYINVQGDEPLIDFRDIRKIIKLKKENFDYVINAYTEINNKENVKNINLPKVVTNEKEELIYMSRNPIPGLKNSDNSLPKYYKQVCIYAFNINELTSFRNFGRKSFLENNEDIEILRFLELDKIIKMFKVKKSSLAVDVPNDVINVEKAL